MLPKCKVEGRPGSLGHEAIGFGFRQQEQKEERHTFQIQTRRAFLDAGGRVGS